MKSMKKLFAVLLVVVLCLGFAVPALAAEEINLKDYDKHPTLALVTRTGSAGKMYAVMGKVDPLRKADQKFVWSEASYDSTPVAWLNRVEDIFVTVDKLGGDKEVWVKAYDKTGAQVGYVNIQDVRPVLRMIVDIGNPPRGGVYSPNYYPGGSGGTRPTPTDPTDPGGPIDPGDPTDPGDPDDPGDPGDPSDPGDPDDPSDPLPQLIVNGYGGQNTNNTDNPITGTSRNLMSFGLIIDQDINLADEYYLEISYVYYANGGAEQITYAKSSLWTGIFTSDNTDKYPDHGTGEGTGDVLLATVEYFSSDNSWGTRQPDLLAAITTADNVVEICVQVDLYTGATFDPDTGDMLTGDLVATGRSGILTYTDGAPDIVGATELVPGATDDDSDDLPPDDGSGDLPPDDGGGDPPDDDDLLPDDGSGG